MTARELLLNAMALPESERVKLAAELLASVPPGEALSALAWESAWLAEVEEREALEPDDSLSAEHELPAVRQRLLGLFPVKRILVVGPIAEREIEATARWYEAREPGLGEGFIVELLRALDDIEERPESFPVLAGAYRRKLLDRFPYAVIYKVAPRRVYVRAVAHGRRRPGYWNK